MNSAHYTRGTDVDNVSSCVLAPVFTFLYCLLLEFIPPTREDLTVKFYNISQTVVPAPKS